MNFVVREQRMTCLSSRVFNFCGDVLTIVSIIFRLKEYTNVV